MILFLEGREEKKNIRINYNSIDDISVLIELKNCIAHHFIEEAKELQRVLDNKLVKYKKYVKHCRSLKEYSPYCHSTQPYPLEPRYYGHITDAIKKLENDANNKIF